MEKEATKVRREEVHHKLTAPSQQKKENLSGTVPASASIQVTTSDGEQQNECFVCMGKYEDNFTHGELQNN